MTEAQIQNKIIKYLDSEGWLTNKLMTMSKNGWPDLIAHKDGKTIYIEVKRPNGRLSKIQEYSISNLYKAGIDVLITNNLEEVKEWITNEITKS